MTEPEASAPPTFAKKLALILLLDAVVVLPWLGRTTLWQIDEGRIAEIAREMATTGDWIVPRMGGEPYDAYPPLAYWLMAATGRVLGFTEFAMRLPSALAGIALIAVVGWMARRLAGDHAALAAAMLTAATPAIFLHQTGCRTDVLVTLFSALAFERFLAIADGDRRWGTVLAMYVSMAFGVLAKGPLAIILPGLGIAAWFALRRQWSLLRDLKLWIGVPLVLALAVPWYVAVTRVAGIEFLKRNLLFENVHAFARGYEQPQPPWFYLKIAPGRFLPWILVLFGAWPVRRTRGLALGLAWTAAIFLFLTISSAKRSNYVTYLSPAVVLSEGIVLAALWNEAPRLLVRWILALGAIVVVLAVVAVRVPFHWSGNLVLVKSLFAPLAIAGIVGIALVMSIAGRAGARAGSVALAGFVAVGVMLHLAVIAPRLDVEGSEGTSFCRRVSARLPEAEPLRTCTGGWSQGSYFFYIRRTVMPNDNEPGYFLGNVEQRDRLIVEHGPKVETLDRMEEQNGRLVLFMQVLR